MKKTILLALTLLSSTLVLAQVNIKGATVDASLGYTIGGAAPSGHVPCGNGTRYVDAASCGAAAHYQFITLNGTALTQAATLNFTTDFTGSTTGSVTTIALSFAGICQTSGTGCPASSVIPLTCVTAGCYEKDEAGVISEFFTGAYSATTYDETLTAVTFPFTCPTAVLGYSVTTATTGSDLGAQVTFTVTSFTNSTITLYSVHNADHGDNPVAPSVIIKCH